jgi:DNA modification methylase
LTGGQKLSLPGPYYETDLGKLYHGDCLDILPHLEPADAIITSPPYNTLDASMRSVGMHARKNGWMKKQSGYYDQMPEEDYQRWQGEVLTACLRAAPVVWINHKIRYRNGCGVHPLHFYKAPLFAEVVWDRSVSMALNCGRFAPSHEYWFGFGKPKKWNRSLNKLMTVWRVHPLSNKDRTNSHPCPFPEKIVAPIVKACVFDGGCIDPFIGSGTTAIACERLGRQWVGIEKEEKYCDLAAKRIEAERQQMKLF